jgi:hypothetical protein
MSASVVVNVVPEILPVKAVSGSSTKVVSVVRVFTGA